MQDKFYCNFYAACRQGTHLVVFIFVRDLYASTWAMTAFTNHL